MDLKRLEETRYWDHHKTQPELKPDSRNQAVVLMLIMTVENVPENLDKPRLKCGF